MSDNCQRERDALATAIADLWGWPSGEAVLDSLRGDHTTRLIRFGENAITVLVGSPKASVSAFLGGERRTG